MANILAVTGEEWVKDLHALLQCSESVTSLANNSVKMIGREGLSQCF